MAAGALDSQGVWQYGEDDAVSPFSTFMNLLAASASSALASKAGGMLAGGYAQITATVGAATTTITTTPVDIAGLACTVSVPAGRRLKLTFDGSMSSSVASDTRGQYGFREGTTLLDYRQTFVFSNANHAHNVHMETILTPTAGSHTYKVSIGRLLGTGTVAVVAAANLLAWLAVEDVGPAR